MESRDCRIQTKETDSLNCPCVLCCKSMPLNLKQPIHNFDSRETNSFCKAFRISEVLYSDQLILAPFCSSCVEMIKSVGSLQECIDSLERRLHLEKNLIQGLLKDQLRPEDELESQLCSAYGFSPFHLRQQLIHELGISPLVPDRTEASTFLDVECFGDVDSLASKPTLASLTVADTGHESDEDWSSPTPTVNSEEGVQEEILADPKTQASMVQVAHTILEERKTRTRVVAKVKLDKEKDIQLKIPAGTVIRPCFVAVERVKISCEEGTMQNAGNMQISRGQKISNEKRVIKKERQKGTQKRKRHPCPRCPRLLASRKSVEAHLKMHTGERDFVCDICGDAFVKLETLVRHGAKRHGKPFPFPCDLCDAGFARKIELKYHGFTHSGNWPVICEVCGAGFTCKGQLNIHTQHNHIQNDGPLLNCEICDKSFPTAFLLTKHQKCHTRKHMCSICSVKCRDISALNKHMLCHTDRRDFVCHLCGADFKLKKHLVSHLKGHDSRKLTFAKRIRQKWRNSSKVSTADKGTPQNKSEDCSGNSSLNLQSTSENASGAGIPTYFSNEPISPILQTVAVSEGNAIELSMETIPNDLTSYSPVLRTLADLSTSDPNVSSFQASVPSLPENIPGLKF